MTKQIARKSLGGRAPRPRRRVKPLMRSETPTHRSVTDVQVRAKLGLSVGNTVGRRDPVVTHTGAHSTFEFTHLPLEIRRMIYLHALTSLASLEFLPPNDDDVNNRFIAHLADTFPTFSISLLCLSKAIHAETLPILYGENTFHFYIGTAETGKAPMMPYGPSPFNTTLALQKRTLPLIRDLKITLITERDTGYMFRARGEAVYSCSRLIIWISALAEAILKGPPLRQLILDHRPYAKYCSSAYVSLQYPGMCEPEKLVEEDEHILDGLKVLRGVGQVSLVGAFTAAYQKEFREQVTTPLPIQEPASRGHVRRRSGKKS